MDKPEIFPSPTRRRGNSMTFLKHATKYKPVIVAVVLSLALFVLISPRVSAPSLARFSSKWRHHQQDIMIDGASDITQAYSDYNNPIHVDPKRPQSLGQQLTPHDPALVADTELEASSAPAEEPKWLLTVHTSASHQLQRNLIRSTWMQLYASPKYEYKFILGNYTNNWDSVIEAENATHGDIWVMPDFMEVEDGALANHVKNWELMKLFVRWEKEGKMRRYEYVSKIDHDLFLNIPRFYEEFMEPRLEGRLNNTRTLIGTMCGWLGWIPHEYACGRFYTMSWDLVELYAELFTRWPIPDTFEDVLNGLLLYRHREVYHPVWIDNDRLGDHRNEVVEKKDPGLARNDTIIVHNLKDSDTFLTYASLFDENGFNGKIVQSYTDPHPYRREAVLEAERRTAELKNNATADGELPYHELRLVKCIELDENNPKCALYDAEIDAANQFLTDPDDVEELTDVVIDENEDSAASEAGQDALENNNDDAEPSDGEAVSEIEDGQEEKEDEKEDSEDMKERTFGRRRRTKR